MRLSFSFRVDKNDKIYSKLLRMSQVSKDLYNQALFEIKCNYEKTGKILSYYELDAKMKTRMNLQGDINYCLLPAQVAQQTLMLVSQNVKSFFSAKASYKEHPQKYQAPPQFPHFLPKDGHFVLVFTNQKAVISSDGAIQLMKDVIIKIPKLEFEKYKQYFIKEELQRIVPLFRQIRIVPKFNGAFFNVELIYEKDELNKALDVNRVASLDFGVDNLITLVDNKMEEENREPIIINGKPIKSINQFYNKRRAEIQAELSINGRGRERTLSGFKRTSQSVMKITDWRNVVCLVLINAVMSLKSLMDEANANNNEKIKDYMHKTSRFVINYCMSHNLGHIVIGKNDGWKQSINVGKRNNQTFVAIPFDKLIQQIQYKGGLRSKLLSVANTVSRH